MKTAQWRTEVLGNGPSAAGAFKPVGNTLAPRAARSASSSARSPAVRTDGGTRFAAELDEEQWGWEWGVGARNCKHVGSNQRKPLCLFPGQSWSLPPVPTRLLSPTAEPCSSLPFSPVSRSCSWMLRYLPSPGTLHAPAQTFSSISASQYGSYC